MSDRPAPSLPRLPAQPADVPWPGGRPGAGQAVPPDPATGADWPEATPGADVDAAALDAAVRALIDLPPEDGVCQAVLVVHRGALVVERYGPETDAGSTLQSWSMAKSMLHAVAGLLVADGRLDPDGPVDAPEWRTPGDRRAAITVRQMLAMRDGLDFTEDYVDEGVSDVMEMLWGAGADDVAHYAASRPLAHDPGAHFAYSSGTTNVLARHLGAIVGGGAGGMAAFLRERLFEPLGMRSPIPKFDAAGTWKASSFCFCTARDFARFGLLYLRDGVWRGQRLLPEGWVDGARTPTHLTDTEGYGLHWWIDAADPRRFYASGYRGQRILIAPDRDLIAIRLGLSPNERVADLMAPLHRIPDAFPER